MIMKGGGQWFLGFIVTKLIFLQKQSTKTSVYMEWDFFKHSNSFEMYDLIYLITFQIEQLIPHKPGCAQI